MQTKIPEKVYFAMRSLFRYVQLKNSNCSEIIIENETAILRKRILELEKSEMEFLILNWDTFYKQESVHQEMRDQLIIKDLTKEILNWN